jgi:hypothetical protein
MEGALFPKEIMDVLNTSFMGFKIWHLLLVALFIPSPAFLIVVVLLIPGFKEKVIGLIRNGIPRVSAVSATGPGEGGQVYSQGDTPYSTEAGGSYRREGEGSVGEQQFQEAPTGFR